jgi:hypothetical protein
MSLVSKSKALVLAMAVAAFAALLVATSAGAQTASTGRVRVMHSSPDAPAVDIFVDGQKAVTALAFPANTGYVALPAGPHNVKVFASPSDGTGSPVLEADLNVAAGKDYTVLAVGRLSDSSLALLPLEDNNAAPAAGNAHVRLIHASPDAPAVDVVVAGTTTKVFSNVAFKGVGTYTPVPAGSYNLEVQTTSGQVVKTVSADLAARTVYTVVAVGLAGNGSLQVVPLVDAAAPAAAPAPSSPAAPATGNTLTGGSGNSAILFYLAGAGLLLAGAGGMAFAVRRVS